MRPLNCPICDTPIPPNAVSFARPFRCPHCDERLRAAHKGESEAARWLIAGGIMVGFLQGVFGWVGYVVVLLLVPYAIELANALVTPLFGYTLEPAGRLSLGDYEE